jgi:hypothetical protein
MVDYGENYILTLYVDSSSTLRAWLGDYRSKNTRKNQSNQAPIDNEFVIIIENLFNYFEFIRNYPGGDSGKINEERRFTIMFNSNVFSAPNSIKKSPLKYVTKLIYFTNYRAISKVKKYINNKSYNKAQGHIHGDLHLNNIIVSRNDIYIIDLENNRNGFFLKMLFGHVAL